MTDRVLVPREPTEAMLKAGFVAMNRTPGGEWKRMKAEGRSPREIFDAKMRPRYEAMISAAPSGDGEAVGHPLEEAALKIEHLEDLLRRVRDYGGIEPQLDCEISQALL